MYRYFLDTIKSEVRAIFTDSGVMLLCVFAIIIYTIIYSTAYGGEVVRNVAIAIVDEDNTPSSISLIDGLRYGPNTELRHETQTLDEAKNLFYNKSVFGIVYIPDGYENHIMRNEQANIAAILDGSHLLLYKQVLEQVSYDAAYAGVAVETAELISQGSNAMEIASIIQPLRLSTTHLYNPSLGYGSFVMPSILIVIIQQTLIIGLAMLRVKRRNSESIITKSTYLYATISVISKLLVYIMIYAINLTLILGIIWAFFGFPFAGKIIDIIILLLLYLVASTSLGLTVSHLFTRRESPIMLLLWSSVPILLLAGISYPKEAFSSIIYYIGHIFPSSSAVDAFISINTMGATIGDNITEVAILFTLAIIYTITAIYTEKTDIINKKLDTKARY